MSCCVKPGLNISVVDNSLLHSSLGSSILSLRASIDGLAINARFLPESHAAGDNYYGIE